METKSGIDNIECWLPVAHAGLVGMTPLVKAQTSHKLPLSRQNDRRVVLNVSGRKFETWEKTLQKYPETLLGSRDKDSFYDKDKREYFFDRDPIFFRHILNFYRKGKLHFSLEECATSYEDELKFFRISTDNVDLCCWEEFEDSASVSRRTGSQGNGHLKRCDCSTPRKTTRQKLWDLFENPYNSILGKVFYVITGIAIVVSILATVTETIPCGNNLTCGQENKQVFFVVDGICVAIFTIEYLVRLFAAPRRWLFIKDFQSIIDVASVLPFYLDLCLDDSSGAEGLTILRVFRVFRVVKMSRHSKRLRSLGTSIKNSSSELGFILFSFSLGVIIFATVIYYCEKNEQNTTFLSIPDGMWYAIVTMTTTGEKTLGVDFEIVSFVFGNEDNKTGKEYVLHLQPNPALKKLDLSPLGYGDMTPETTLGQLMGSICCIVGTLVIALPVPILEMKMKLVAQGADDETDECEEQGDADGEHIGQETHV